MAPSWVMLEQHLAQAEDHVCMGERHLTRQREIVDELARGGHDTFESRRLLTLFGELQAEHVAHRDRLRRALDVQAAELRRSMVRPTLPGRSS